MKKVQRKSSQIKSAACLSLALMLACNAQAFLFGPKGHSTAEKRGNIRKQRDEMLAELYASKPPMKKTIKHAAGYATFKQVNVNLFLLATANGYGVVVDNRTKKETFMRMGSIGGGIGAGVKDVRVIFVFYNPTKKPKQQLPASSPSSRQPQSIQPTDSAAQVNIITCLKLLACFHVFVAQL